MLFGLLVSGVNCTIDIGATIPRSVHHVTSELMVSGTAARATSSLSVSGVWFRFWIEIIDRWKGCWMSYDRSQLILLKNRFKKYSNLKRWCVSWCYWCLLVTGTCEVHLLTRVLLPVVEALARPTTAHHLVTLGTAQTCHLTRIPFNKRLYLLLSMW